MVCLRQRQYFLWSVSLARVVSAPPSRRVANRRARVAELYGLGAGVGAIAVHLNVPRWAVENDLVYLHRYKGVGYRGRAGVPPRIEPCPRPFDKLGAGRAEGVAPDTTCRVTLGS